MGQRGDSEFGLQVCGCHVLERKELDGFGRTVEQESVVRKSALQTASLEPRERRDVVSAQLDVEHCLVARRGRDAGHCH